MKRRFEVTAENEDLGKEKVKIVVYLDNNQQDFFSNITDSTRKRLEWYKDEVYKMLSSKFHVSEIRIKGASKTSKMEVKKK